MSEYNKQAKKKKKKSLVVQRPVLLMESFLVFVSGFSHQSFIINTILEIDQQLYSTFLVSLLKAL